LLQMTQVSLASFRSFDNKQPSPSVNDRKRPTFFQRPWPADENRTEKSYLTRQTASTLSRKSEVAEKAKPANQDAPGAEPDRQVQPGDPPYLADLLADYPQLTREKALK